MSFSMKVTGAKEVAASLNKGVKKPVENNLPKLAQRVEANVKRATVVGESGFLRARTTRSMPTKESALISNPMEYAEPVEYGTYKMEARHMVGGTKVLGEGMFAYVLRQMAPDLKGFEVKVAKEVEGEFK